MLSHTLLCDSLKTRVGFGVCLCIDGTIDTDLPWGVRCEGIISLITGWVGGLEGGGYSLEGGGYKSPNLENRWYFKKAAVYRIIEQYSMLFITCH